MEKSPTTASDDYVVFKYYQLYVYKKTKQMMIIFSSMYESILLHLDSRESMRTYSVMAYTPT